MNGGRARQGTGCRGDRSSGCCDAGLAESSVLIQAGSASHRSLHGDGTVPVVRVLYRDELVIAIDKPAGLATVPGRRAGTAGRGGAAGGASGAGGAFGADGASASGAASAGLGDEDNGAAEATVRSARGEAEESDSLLAQVRLFAPDALAVHRLDRDTSGVVVFALGRSAHRALSMAFESRRAEKTYLGLCRGEFLAARCDLPLTDGRRGGMRVATVAGSRALPSSTEFRPLEKFAGFTWVEARPRTGRTHQIRVHLAALGHPLAIDPRYGDARVIAARELLPGSEGVALARLPLHAAALRVPHPSGQGWLSLEAPLPADLARCLELLRAHRRA